MELFVPAAMLIGLCVAIVLMLIAAGTIVFLAIYLMIKFIEYVIW